MINSLDTEMQAHLQQLLAAIKEAGTAIMALQKTGFSIMRKLNRDVVTAADLAANDILKSKLMAVYPQYGWLSEESPHDPLRLAAPRTWIVDPIDGTREFIKGIPEFAISVALVEAQQVILSAVFNPAKNQLYYAVKGHGAWHGEQRLYCRRTDVANYLFLASRTEYNKGKWHQFQQHTVQPIGSIAYKLALLAAGKADATFSLGPKNEWDIAAGVLLVQEAGGVICDKHGNTILFNQENVLVPGIVASAAVCHADIMQTITAAH